MKPYWEGNLVRLRATEPDDAEFFYLLNQERDVDRNLDMVWPPSSMARQREFVARSATEGFRDGHDYVFQMESIASGEHVGTIDTHHTNPRQGTFEYGLSVREPYRNRGFASEAILLVLRYYFFELRYRKAEPCVFAFNDASIALHKKLGFVEEGRRRLHGYSNGQFHDLLLYGMTMDEFRELHPNYADRSFIPIDA